VQGPVSTVTTTKTVTGPGGETTVTKTITTGGNSWDVAPDPIPDSQIVKTVDADIVIVGAGLAGTSAACRAAQLGAKVAVIEKMEKPSSRGGHYAAYQTPAMTAAGLINVPKEDILREWVGMCGNRCNEKLVWQYLDRSTEAFTWLEDISEGSFEWQALQNHYVGSWYYEHFGTHSGRYTGDDNTDRLSGPLFTAYKYAKNNNADFFFNTTAEQLIKSNNKVIGVVAKDANGYIKFNASKAVILATGDISGNDEMVNFYCHDLARLVTSKAYTPAGANTGDGHKMGMWAGGHMELGPLPTMLHLIRYTMLSFFYLHVNALGKRFMNEDTWIQGKSIRIMTQPEGYNEYCFSIFDDDWRDQIKDSLQYGGGQFWDNMSVPAGTEWTPDSAERTINGAIERGTAWKADTLEELASLMGVDREIFLSEVERYNQIYDQGEDTDFHKRVELLTPIRKPPFYALKVGPSLLVIPGGLEVNESCQVVDDQKVAIPGLYAVGNVMGGRYGVDYPVKINGNSHGSAITFGYIAAGNILGEV
jgi:succinate dehydrogenase/fumarate reductase flavoprotein subunit